MSDFIYFNPFVLMLSLVLMFISTQFSNTAYAAVAMVISLFYCLLSFCPSDFVKEKLEGGSD